MNLLENIEFTNNRLTASLSMEFIYAPLVRVQERFRKAYYLALIKDQLKRDGIPFTIGDTFYSFSGMDSDKVAFDGHVMSDLEFFIFNLNTSA